MPRTFASASSEKIDLSLGAGGSLNGAISFAAIVKKATDGVTYVLVQAGTLAASRRNLQIGTSNKIFMTSNNSQTAVSVTTTAVTDGWLFLAMTKAVGTATPRCHFYKYSTATWTHENAVATATDSTPTSAMAIGYNPASNNAFFNGTIAATGIWASALTDAQVETLAYSLTPWFSYSPKGLWVLDQAAVGTKVWDLTGNGANESARVGTTPSTSAVPVWNRGHLPIVITTDTTVIPPTPPATTQQLGGKSLGRRGPWYPDRTPEQVLRDEEELMVIL